VEFVVDCPPLTWKRTNGFEGKRVTPKEQRAYQALVRSIGMLRRPVGWPMDARYKMTVTVYRKADSGDFDNFAKNVADALQGALYDNDRRIKDGRCILEIDRKRPRVEVVVEVMP
jgi:Holliday junction resolvase RusA-like endonuclease